jgi:hypothetical protein
LTADTGHFAQAHYRPYVGILLGMGGGRLPKMLIDSERPIMANQKTGS